MSDGEEIELLEEETSLYAEETSLYAEQLASMSNKLASLHNKVLRLHNKPTSHAHERPLTPPSPLHTKRANPRGRLSFNLPSIPFAPSLAGARQNLLQTLRRLQIPSPHRTTTRTSSLSRH